MAGTTQVGTSATYTVQVADLGKTITLVIKSNVETGAITSDETAAVAKKAAPSAPDKPTLVSQTHNSVTLTPNPDYEFCRDSEAWQTSNQFTGLTPSTEYTFYQRVAATADTLESAASPEITIKTADTPTYGIALSPATDKDFGSAVVGYEAQAAHSVTVSNTGNQATGALTVALSGTNADSFTLSATSINSIATSGSGTFTVVPNTGLGAGTYTATVTVSGDNGISASFTVSFTVDSKTPCSVTVTAPDDITYGHTLGNPSAVTSLEVSDATFTYWYTGILADGSNTSYSSADKPADPGSYTVSATLVSATHMGTSEPASFTISKKNLIWATNGTPASKTYDGTTVATASTQPTFGGVLDGDAASVQYGTLTFGGANAGSNIPVTASGYGMTGDDAWKYNAPIPQPTFANGTITPKATTFTIGSIASISYTGQEQTPAVVVNDGGITLAVGTDYDVSYSGNTNAGTASVTVTGKGNYLGSTGNAQFTINKIAYTGTTSVTESVFANGKTGATVTLPSLPDGANYGDPTASGTITMTNLSISGSTLTYTAPESTEGQSGTITIPVTGAANYSDYEIVVTVTSTAKTPQDISFEETSVTKTYGDEAFANTLTQTAGDGTISYQSSDTGVVTVDATGKVTIVAAGSATITATAEETDTYAETSASYTVTVLQKALTLNADDKSMTKGDNLPDLTYTVTGLAYSDAVTNEPTISASTDGTEIGNFDITISNAVVTNGASYDITYTKGTLTVAERLYTATVTNGTGGGEYAAGVTVTITANDRSGYTFTGWSGADVTFADAAAKTTTFTMPEKAVTVTANYRRNSSGVVDNGGESTTDGSSAVIVTLPTSANPTAPTQGEIQVAGVADSNGSITVSVTDKIVTDAFDKALAEAEKVGKEQNGITVVLRVDTGSKSASDVTVNLPKSVLDTIIAQKIVSTVVVVDNPGIQIAMNLAAVTEISQQAKTDVNITATGTDHDKLGAEAKNAIGNRPVFDLKVCYGKDKEVRDFGAGSVWVVISYTLGADEKAENVQAVYVDETGKVHWLESSVYDSEEKVLRFSTSHLSTYGVLQVIGRKRALPLW